MNIIIISDYAAPYGGNFIPSLLELEKRWNEKKVSCIFAFPKEAGRTTWVNALLEQGKVIELLSFYETRRKFIKETCALIDKYNADYLYSHFCSALKIEVLSFLRKKTKVFIHLHSDFTLGKKTLKYSIYKKVVFGLLSFRVHFISVSKAFVDFNPKRITWVPNGLAKRRLVTRHCSGTEYRNQIGVKNSDYLLEIFGWSPMVKGVDIAVRSVDQVNKLEGSKVKLLIICGSAYTPAKMKQFISEHTACSGDEDFLIYAEPQEDVYTFHEAADCLLSTSRSEGFSYAILEMLSIGKKCIVSDIPGVSWAKEYEGVTAFKSESIDACSREISRKVCEEKHISQHDIDRINQELSIEKWASHINILLGI